MNILNTLCEHEWKFEHRRPRDHMKKILMVFIEPTPYILDLIYALEKTEVGKIDVIFLKENFSQNWKLSLNDNYIVLKKNESMVKMLYQRIIKEKYDAIFLAGWSHPTTLVFLMLSKIFRIPVVIDSDTPLLPNTLFWKRVIKRIVYPVLFTLPNLFLPGGTRQANYLKHYFVPCKKIILEKMTVNVLTIQKSIDKLPSDARIEFRKQLELTDKDIIFLYVGRLIERKGIQELLEAFSNINNPFVKCVIVGDGPLKPIVEEVAKVNHNIIYVGWLEKYKIIEVLFMSDIFVLPAHWEPWGLVINEAMAAGKPVIVTDQVGCADDLVIDKKTGLIIKSKSVADLTTAINYLLDNPKQCQIMSKNALELISHWTLEDSAKQICIALSNSMKIVN